MSPEFLQQWAKIQAADAIEDPTERCLAYPDAPWLHWKPEIVAAFCRTLSFHFISAAEMRTALEQGHPEILDQAFQTYFDENFSVPEKRGMLSRAYRSFEHTSSETKEIVEKWTALAPHSAFALAARGTYYLDAAGEARGSAVMRDTAEEGLKNMEELAHKAYSDFQAALAINPRLIWADSEMIRIGRMVSSRELVEQSVKAALAIDPADDRTYLDWMMASEPRWGGSRQQMLAIAHTAEQHVGENPLLALVMEKPSSDSATFTHNYSPEALETLDRALLIAPSPFDLKFAGYTAMDGHLPEKAIWYFSESNRFFNSSETLSERASALIALGRVDLAKQSLGDVSKLTAQDPSQLRSLAGTLWRLDRLADAEKLYITVLERNPLDQDALVDLSQLYLNKPLQPEKAKPLLARLLEHYPNNARGWLLSSIGKPDAECHAALRKYLELVDPNDSYEQPSIAMAKKRLGELEHASN
jgi:tetratricopeptide (TPR) repeat protein